MNMQRSGARGHTLLELAISMALGLLVVVASLSLYRGQRASHDRAADIARMHDAATAALDLVGQQLQMAAFAPLGSDAGVGLFGCFQGRATGTDDAPTCESLREPLGWRLDPLRGGHHFDMADVVRRADRLSRSGDGRRRLEPLLREDEQFHRRARTVLRRRRQAGATGRRGDRTAAHFLVAEGRGDRRGRQRRPARPVVRRSSRPTSACWCAATRSAR